MVRRTLKAFVAWEPILVALLCGMLMVCAVPVTQVVQLLVSAEDVEPLEEDEAPLEDPFDAGSVPQRVSLREDLRGAFDLRSVQQLGTGSADYPGLHRTTAALNADELAGRNGCGANLRC